MKRTKIKANYLENIPVVKEGIEWTKDDKGIVTLHVENKGVVKRLTQILLRKPKVSHIHLDENGSFAWLLIDGNRCILDMGEPVKEHFGEKAEPLYPRLAQFFKILETNKFIEYKK
ncbi:MAG: PqqD family protein [Clostridia bacterium]|nr:PqqD family protein [Clostridia bacterium]